MLFPVILYILLDGVGKCPVLVFKCVGGIFGQYLVVRLIYVNVECTLTGFCRDILDDGETYGEFDHVFYLLRFFITLVLRLYPDVRGIQLCSQRYLFIQVFLFFRQVAYLELSIVILLA